MMWGDIALLLLPSCLRSPRPGITQPLAMNESNLLLSTHSSSCDGAMCR